MLTFDVEQFKFVTSVGVRPRGREVERLQDKRDRIRKTEQEEKERENGRTASRAD